MVTDRGAVRAADARSPQVVGSPVTDLLMILDRSGSMADGGTKRSKWERLVALSRESVAVLQSDQQQGQTENRVSVVVLGDIVQPSNIWKRPVLSIDTDRFLEGHEAEGNTPLLDAIGTGVTRLSIEDDCAPAHAYLVQIFTDGHENASTHYRGPTLDHRIKRLQDTGRWTFTWMIAGADLNGARRSLPSIPEANLLQIPDGAAGFDRGAKQNSKSLSDFLLTRRAGNSQKQTFYLTSGT